MKACAEKRPVTARCTPDHENCSKQARMPLLRLCCMILQDIHNEMARHLSSTAGSAAGLARAQAYERGNDFVRAVDTYLSLTPADVESLDVLQQCWEQVRLAFQAVATAVLSPHASNQAANCRSMAHTCAQQSL